MVLAKLLDKQLETTVLLFVEFNTTIAPAKCDGEKRGFGGAVIGQTCWCKTAHGDQH